MERRAAGAIASGLSRDLPALNATLRFFDRPVARRSAVTSAERRTCGCPILGGAVDAGFDDAASGIAIEHSSTISWMSIFIPAGQGEAGSPAICPIRT